MMAKYLHVGINFFGEEPAITNLIPVFNRAHDWLRYAPNCWILYTSASPDTWVDRVREKIDKEDYLFICELILDNHQGWLSQDLWDWINKDRSAKRES
jgi:hypothetical protein